MKSPTSITLLVVVLLLAGYSAAAPAAHDPASAAMQDATPTAAPSPTADPYAGLSIDHLAARSYGGGELQIIEAMETNEAFTRFLIVYPSDGLRIYGFMNAPHGQGPFPVVIAVHGYINPGVYTTLDYTTRYADALASAGYLVIHPNLRGYPPSDNGPNKFRVGFAVDVLNLIALVRGQGGQPGPLQTANPNAIGLWGHSMGGGVSLRVITISPDVRAAVLYGSMSGDERKNYERVRVWSNGARGREELSTPDDVLHRISPINYLDRVQAVLGVHHGESDETVPLAWSLDLCERFLALGKTVDCHTYPGQPHTFQGDGDQLFIRRTIAFFDTLLKRVPTP